MNALFNSHFYHNKQLIAWDREQYEKSLHSSVDALPSLSARAIQSTHSCNNFSYCPLSHAIRYMYIYKLFSVEIQEWVKTIFRVLLLLSFGNCVWLLKCSSTCTYVTVFRHSPQKLIMFATMM